eukprot:GHUV01035567.1.p1 GENE.GHUV01035567.1~~GHUV01035567.1.p1  ORF type:complete len:663 (+),score=181.06 GHUV01035567.1:855-2843(+)
MDYGPTTGLSAEGQPSQTATTSSVGAWGPVLYYPTGAAVQQPAFPFAQQPGQQQQQLYYNPYIPVLPALVAAPGHLPFVSTPASAAVNEQQVQLDLTLDTALQQQPVQQAPQPEQQQEEQSDRASSEDNGALFDLLTDFERKQRSSGQQQWSPPSDPLIDDFLDNVYEQQRIAEQLEQQRQQQAGPPGIGQATVGGMAAYPYQAVYGNQQYNTTQQQYGHPSHQAYGCQPYHHGVAIGYNYGAYVPQQHIPQQPHLPPPSHQQQQQHHQQRPPWATSWAAGVQKRQGEVPPGFASSEGSRPSSAGEASTARTTAGTGRPVDPPAVGSSLGVLAGLHDVRGIAAKIQKRKKHPRPITMQAALTALEANRLAGKHDGGTPSRNSPEEYLRSHVGHVDPFWASATSGDTGLLAVTHLPPSSCAGGGVAVVQTTSFDVALSSAQMTMIKSRTAVLQLICLLVNDKIPHRCHWPCSANVCVNGQLARNLYAAKRIPNAPLKPQQIDMPADIGSYAASKTAVKLTYTSNSSGYVVGVRLVRKQSIDRVKQMVAKPQSLASAVAAVKQKLAGDGDVEVSVNAVSLRCPLTAMRMKTPAHFTSAPGLAYFDLDSFLELTQRSGKWQVGVARHQSAVTSMFMWVRFQLADDALVCGAFRQSKLYFTSCATS